MGFETEMIKCGWRGEWGILETSVVNNRIPCSFEERQKKITKKGEAHCGGREGYFLVMVDKGLKVYV